MGSFIGWNRYKIKRHLEQLLEQNTLQEFDDMYPTLALLKLELFKYGIMVKIDDEALESTIADVYWALGHHFNAYYRQEDIQKSIKKINDLLVGYEKDLSIIKRLIFISDDLDQNLGLLFSKDGFSFKDDILDSFASLQDLSSEIRSYGYETYQLYRQLMRSVNLCKPYLPLSTPDVGKDGRVMIRPNELKDVKNHIGPLMSYLGDLIAVFNEPEKPKEEKKATDSEKSKDSATGPLMNKDELEKQRIFKESSNMIINDNMSWENVARHFDITSQELLEIWDLEEPPEAVEEQEEDNKEKSEQKKKSKKEVEQQKTEKTYERDQDTDA